MAKRAATIATDSDSGSDVEVDLSEMWYKKRRLKQPPTCIIESSESSDEGMTKNEYIIYVCEESDNLFELDPSFIVDDGDESERSARSESFGVDENKSEKAEEIESVTDSGTELNAEKDLDITSTNSNKWIFIFKS